MTHRRYHRGTPGLVAAVLSAFVVTAATAQTSDPASELSDVEGSKDNPAIKRYEGSIIIGYEFQKFGEAEILLGPVKGGGPGNTNDLKPTKSQRVEGQVTRLLYVVPQGRSPLEVLRNYEQELKQSGFKTVYQCAKTECGSKDGWLADYLYGKRTLKQTPATGGGVPQGQISSTPWRARTTNASSPPNAPAPRVRPMHPCTWPRTTSISSSPRSAMPSR